MRKINGILVILVLLIVGTIFVTKPDVSAQSAISIQGLAMLQQSAADSVPYSVALANNKPTFLEFYANWCTTCQSMAPSIAQLHQTYGEMVNFVMINIDDPQWIEPIETYQVTGVPQITLLDQTHQVTWTQVGKVPATILNQVLELLASPGLGH